jgi:hypothetical protein
MADEHAINLLNIFLICILFHNYLNRDFRYKFINFTSSLYILACSFLARILYSLLHLNPIKKFTAGAGINRGNHLIYCTWAFLVC